jgi:cytochrome c553
MAEIRDGKRVDVPAEMFEVLSMFSNADLVLVAAYMASLNTPESLLCRNPATKTKK